MWSGLVETETVLFTRKGPRGKLPAAFVLWTLSVPIQQEDFTARWSEAFQGLKAPTENREQVSLGRGRENYLQNEHMGQAEGRFAGCYRETNSEHSMFSCEPCEKDGVAPWNPDWKSTRGPLTVGKGL